jgi:hypothetical protein
VPRQPHGTRRARSPRVVRDARRINRLLNAYGGERKVASSPLCEKRVKTLLY